MESGKPVASWRIVALLIVAAVLLLAGYTVYRVQTAKEPPPPPLPYESHCVGVEPSEPPEFDVSIDLTLEGARSVLSFAVTERHGWCVDGVYVEFWPVEQDESGEWRQVAESVTHLCRGYLDFDATLFDSTTLTEAEYPEMNGDYGTAENWRARVSDYHQVLAPQE